MYQKKNKRGSESIEHYNFRINENCVNKTALKFNRTTLSVGPRHTISAADCIDNQYIINYM